MMQTDLSSHPKVADDLVRTYRNWATEQHPNQPAWALADDTIAKLKRTGDTINAQGGTDIPSDQKDRLNTFLASSEGRTWVHQQDMNQIDTLMEKAVEPMQGTALYKSKSIDADSRISLLVIAAKAYNQSETSGRRIIELIHTEDIKTVHDLRAAIETHAKTDRHADPYHIASQVRADSPKAQQSADLVVALQHATPANPLKDMWIQEAVRMAQPPDASPGNAQAQSIAQAQQATLSNLFANYDGGRAQAFVKAIDQQQPYPPNVAIDQRMTLVTDGHNLVTLDHVGKSGQGYAWVGGEPVPRGWRALAFKRSAARQNHDHGSA